MKKYLLLLLLFSIKLFSQNYNSIKESDTIYIEFKGKINERKYSIDTRIKPNNFDERAYNFVLPGKFGLYFQHPEFKNWEKKEANIISEVRIVNKAFFKKNKEHIIGINFLKKYEQNDIICQLFTQLKVFYIIDFTEKKKGNVMLYEVNSMNVCPVSE
ncbi:hypothetical protein FVB9288_02885 [Flavobacterium sp. CECT 9288]|uniref:hypothetical protein n=1 Tax=Flavobacterium sp. CECT 9288 TaxID=2845819 RepID=UPI001E4B7CF7|nr:hypothetical protein [Flavobacterium sp. CECT 9288]CAH0337141.1 hypothetical protein FVB9288_02885 [Flavobacterium sp. CECT 9288]